MKRFARVLISILLSAVPLHAQVEDPDFWIGSWGVSPVWDDSTRTCLAISGVDSFQPGAVAKHVVSTLRLDQARALGLNLVGAGIRTFPKWGEDHIRRDLNTWRNNAVEELCIGASVRDQQVSVADGQLNAMFRAERIILHPESADDFASSGFETESEHDFTKFIIDNNPFTTSLEERLATINCVKLKPDTSEVSGLSDLRFDELSAFRDEQPPWRERLSGVYQLSVIVKPITGFGLPEIDRWDTPLLHVDVWSSNAGGTGTVRHRFSLPGSRFWYVQSVSPDTVWALKDSVQEYVLGRIELLQDESENPPLLYAIQGGDESWWHWTDSTHTGAHRTSKNQPVRDDPDRGAFDIRLSYGEDDAACYVDAICLTNPATFGLWHGTHDSTIAAHAHLTDSAAIRLAHLCRGDTIPSLPVLPGLRFLYGPEQVPESGTYWSAFLFQRLLDEVSGGKVDLYVPHGSWVNTATTPAMASECVSGLYSYPLLDSHPRPTIDTTGSGSYYGSIYHQDGFSFRSMWEHLRSHADTRSQYNPDKPLIPFIQNHSNLYPSTEQDGPGWWDKIPNREPSAAELRLLCNAALVLMRMG